MNQVDQDVTDALTESEKGDQKVELFNISVLLLEGNVVDNSEDQSGSEQHKWNEDGVEDENLSLEVSILTVKFNVGLSFVVHWSDKESMEVIDLGHEFSEQRSVVEIEESDESHEVKHGAQVGKVDVQIVQHSAFSQVLSELDTLQGKEENRSEDSDEHELRDQVTELVGSLDTGFTGWLDINGDFVRDLEVLNNWNVHQFSAFFFSFFQNSSLISIRSLPESVSSSIDVFTIGDDLIIVVISGWESFFFFFSIIRIRV